jgi:DUF4097 and DUF4098 domain-containing protein YvlB
MATKANIIIDQGTDFSIDIELTNDNGDVIDLTGFTGSAQMRKHYSSSNSQSFSVSLGGAAGTVTLQLNHAQTRVLTPGRYVYDVEVASSSNVVSRIVEGIATVTPEVTR